MGLKTINENFFDNEDRCENILHEHSGINFNVAGDFSILWFKTFINQWERETFHILNYYAPKYGRESFVNANDIKKKIYLDIGAWIGPTTLYAANFYTKVVALEPDPVALEILKKNIFVNNYNNITVVDKALAIVDDSIIFGGNGELGNSESTMLVSNSRYITECWGGRWTSEERKQNIIEVEGITMSKLLEINQIDPKEIALIKMDIEGGEFMVIPHLATFLLEHNIPLYISLHYVFLKEEHVKFILKILFDIYNDCYIFNNSGHKIRITMKRAIKEQLTALVFENIKRVMIRKHYKESVILQPRISLCSCCSNFITRLPYYKLKNYHDIVV